MRDRAYSVRIAQWPADAAAIQHVRECVFVEEQRIPAELEWDGLDSQCIHVLVSVENRDAVGTARLEPTGKIGRVSVLKPLRKQGIGTVMVQQLVAEARRAGYAEVYLHAQVDSLHFYKNLGFYPEGAQFDEAGIPHRKMRLDSEN